MLFLDCRNVFASDTREKSRFKIKHTEPSTNVEGTTNSGDNSQDDSNSRNNDNQTLFTAAAQKKNRQSQKEKKQKESRNIIRTFLMIQSRKVILLKATDFRLSLNLSVTNGNFLVKWQIMSITSFRALCQKRRYNRIFSNYSLSLRISGVLKNWTIF